MTETGVPRSVHVVHVVCRVPAIAREVERVMKRPDVGGRDDVDVDVDVDVVVEISSAHSRVSALRVVVVVGAAAATRSVDVDVDVIVGRDMGGGMRGAVKPGS